jgi:hypothetical protein
MIYGCLLNLLLKVNSNNRKMTLSIAITLYGLFGVLSMLVPQQIYYIAFMF